MGLELQLLSLREELNTRWTCVFDACGGSSAQEIPLVLPFSRPRQALEITEIVDMTTGCS
jgi:hypothetical protein